MRPLLDRRPLSEPRPPPPAGAQGPRTRPLPLQARRQARHVLPGSGGVLTTGRRTERSGKKAGAKEKWLLPVFG